MNILVKFDSRTHTLGRARAYRPIESVSGVESGAFLRRSSLRRGYVVYEKDEDAPLISGLIKCMRYILWSGMWKCVAEKEHSSMHDKDDTESFPHQV